jgi:hypothetical protein
MKRVAKDLLIITAIGFVIAAIGYTFLSSMAVSGDGDCWWIGPATTWIDLNEDGLRQPDEPPLEGVTINALNRLGGGHPPVTSAVSEFDGIAEVALWGCPNSFEVESVVPDGYELTTEPIVEVSVDRELNVTGAEFGFAPLPGTELPGQYVPALTCKQHSGFGANDLNIMPNGLWAGGTRGVHLIDKDTLRTKDSVDLIAGLISPDSIIPTQNGMWVDGGSWGYFDGTSWTIFELNRGETFSEITVAAHELDDGRLWFTAPQFFAIYDRQSDTLEAQIRQGVLGSSITRFAILTYNGDWFIARIAEQGSLVTLFDPEWTVVSDQILLSSHIEGLTANPEMAYFGTAVAPDGSIWVGGGDEVVGYVPSSDTWLDFRLEDGDIRPTFKWIRDIAAHPDGSIWLSDARSILRLIPLSDTESEAEWQQFDPRDGFVDGTSEHIAIDADGTIWLAGEAYGSVLNRCRLIEDQDSQ